MNHIIVVRHGQDEDNAAGILNGHRDTQLTELGRTQARAVARKLLDDSVEYIYTSPLKRAYETARIIADTIEIDDVTVKEDLKERDFGVLTGKPVYEVENHAEELLRTNHILYFTKAEGAENFPALYGRAERVLERIDKRHDGETILLVTHGDIGKMIQAAYHGWSWEEGLKAPHLPNTGVLHLMSKRDVVE